MIKNYGLQEALIALDEYVLGQSPMPWIEYNETGDWTPYLPTYETQYENFETNGCTVFHTLNQIETLYKLLYGTEENYSERFIFNLTPVDIQRGADPQRVFETIRDRGLIDQKYLPMTDTPEAFDDDSAITGSMLAKGQNWLIRHDFQHEWIWTIQPDNWIEVLKDALKTSPIALSVTAWHTDGAGSYVDKGLRNNHWVMCSKVDEEGYPWVYDTYEHKHKRLAKTHHITRAKRIWINKKTKSGMRRHISLLEKILKKLLMKQTLLDVAKSALGTDVSPRDIAPDELACAESVTELMRKVYPETSVITGTWTLLEYLHASPTWTEVLVAQPGAIVISATGTGKKGTVGHVGVCLEDDLIASNTSFGVNKGRFLQNFTVGTWNRRYRDTQGMPVRYFVRVV